MTQEKGVVLYKNGICSGFAVDLARQHLQAVHERGDPHAPANQQRYRKNTKTSAKFSLSFGNRGRTFPMFSDFLVGSVPPKAAEFPCECGRSYLKSADSLANPPGGIRTELETLLWIDLLDRDHQPMIAFLNEIEQGQTCVLILIRDADHQA